MERKAVSGIMLTMLLASMLSIALDVPLIAAETDEMTELTITNPEGCTDSGSIVYWTFEIIDPHRVAAPGETVYFRMRITNLPESDIPLRLRGASLSYPSRILPYVSQYWDITWPVVPIGETYEGPFAHFCLATTAPPGLNWTGTMWAHVYYGSPETRSVKYSVTIPIPAIPATVDIDPDTLNLKSNGEFVTAYIELPAGYNVADIDLTTVQLEGISAITDPQYGFVTDPASYLVDHDADGIMERMVKFDRATVRDTLTGMTDYEQGVKFYELTLKVTGMVAGTPFEGTDTIVVLKN